MKVIQVLPRVLVISFSLFFPLQSNAIEGFDEEMNNAVYVSSPANATEFDSSWSMETIQGAAMGKEDAGPFPLISPADPFVMAEVGDQDVYESTENTFGEGTDSLVASEDVSIQGVDTSRLQEAPAGDPNRLSISITSSWLSKYLVRGVDFTDDSGFWLNTADFGFWDTGFHFQFVGAYPSHDRGKSIFERFDPPIGDILQGRFGNVPRRNLDGHVYSLYWQGEPCEGISLRTGLVYDDFFHLSSQKADFWEGFAELTFAELPLSPFFGAYYGTPRNSDSPGEGWMTNMGVQHFVPFSDCSFLCWKPLGINVKADIWYNGGELFPHADTGWSFARVAAAMPIPLQEKLTLIPGVSYQYSIEETINSENELFGSVTLSYSW